MSTWRYNSATGEFGRDGRVACIGYSGFEQGKNSPEYEGIVDIGPIPRGLYQIGLPHTSARTGPLSFNLTPIGHDARGRTDFKVHGDNARHNASHGCVIITRFYREALAFDVTQSSEKVTLEVV